MTKDICKLLEQDGNIVFFDLETSGLSRKKDRIIQFSAIRCETKTLSEVDRINMFIKCPFSIPEKITKINHIDDDLLEREGLDEKDAIDKIREFIKDGDIISGYNNKSFDDPFLEAFYMAHGYELQVKESIDVYRYAKSLIPAENVLVEDDKTGRMKASYKLSIVVGFYDPDNQFNFHDAADDIAATKFVFERLVEDGKRMIAEAEAEEEKRKEIPRQKVKVFSLGFFSPSQNVQRVYVNTDQGKIYYDYKKHEWNTKNGNIDSIDVEDLRVQAFSLVNVTDEENFFREMRRIKFA